MAKIITSKPEVLWNLKCTLGEGTLWVKEHNSIYFVHQSEMPPINRRSLGRNKWQQGSLRLLCRNSQLSNIDSLKQTSRLEEVFIKLLLHQCKSKDKPY